MARITLFPADGTVTINGTTAFGVNYFGVDLTIHCVQWYDTIGQIEYIRNPMTGEGPANEDITSIAPYQDYITQAEEIIYAAENPVVVYVTSDGTTWEGDTYQLGDQITISTPDTLPPSQSTQIVPPTLQSYQQLYWNGVNWVASAFPITDTLPQAKTNLIGQVQTNAAVAADEQARIYSMLQLVQDAAPGDLPCADYSGETLGEYQTFLDDQVVAKTAQINATATTAELYGFNPNVDTVP
jgi:hypothetical protein